MSCSSTVRVKPDLRRRREFSWDELNNCNIENEDNDCQNLNWLLNFKLDDLVNKRKVSKPEIKRAKCKKESKFESNSTYPKHLHSYVMDQKPPYTYTELIEKALREKGELTVSAIYQWISERYPFYKNTDERWKNSVRHNLSINPHFRKGGKASHGAGHLWSLAANAIDLLPKRKEHREFDRMFPNVIVIDEAALAAASILPDNEVIISDTAFLNPISSEQVIRECGLLSLD